MEQKKTPKADMARQRTTGFLLGVVLVLALLYVALEWNSSVGGDDVNPVDISEMIHESELIPMSNEELVTQLEDKQKDEKSEELNIVDDEVELSEPEEAQGSDGEDDESVLSDLVAEDDKALAPLNVDPQNPLNFHVVEDLPQYPGGAVELMKWLTKNLRYPPVAQQQKVQGKEKKLLHFPAGPEERSGCPGKRAAALGQYRAHTVCGRRRSGLAAPAVV